MSNITRIPLIVAHRGDMEHAPENTLSAFESAANKGADIIEFDVHLTNDEEIVVHHDYYLERTTNGDGYIGTQALGQSKTLDVGSWFSEDHGEEKIPTLDEVLETLRGKVHFEIEIKTPSTRLVQRVIEKIEHYGLQPDVSLTSWKPIYSQVKRINPRFSCGYIFGPFPEWMEQDVAIQHVVGVMKLVDAQAAHIPVELVKAKNVKAIQKEGFRVHGYFNEQSDRLEEGFQCNLDQLSTNFLDRALEIKSKLANT